MIDTKLEVARLHVVDGQQLILRQKQLVARLRQRGSEQLVQEAEMLLAQLRELQAAFEAYLADLENKQ